MDSSEKDYKRLYQEALAEISSLKNQIEEKAFLDDTTYSEELNVYGHSTDYCQFPVLLICEGEIKRCNDSAVTFFDVESKEEVISHTILDFSPEIQSDEVPSKDKLHYLLVSMEDAGKRKIHWDFLIKDNLLPAFLYITSVYQEEKLYHIFTVLVCPNSIDEERLRQLSLVANYTGSSVVITDAKRCITWVNHSFSVLTGYELSEVKGRVPGDFLQGALTDPRTVDEIRCSLLAQKPFTAELINYKKTGEPYWVEIKVTPFFSKNGKLKHYIGLSTDITKRKEAEMALKKSEELYRSILTIAQEAIVFVDKEGVTTYANPHYSKLIGLPLEKIVGVPLADSVHPKMKSLWLRKFEERKQGKVGSYDALMATYDRGDVWVHITGVAVRNDEGVFHGSLVMMSDINERKLNEERLLRRDVLLTALTESQRVLMDVEVSLKDSVYNALKILSESLKVDLMRLIRWGDNKVSIVGEYNDSGVVNLANDIDEGVYLNYRSAFYQKLEGGDCLEMDTLELLDYRDFLGNISNSTYYLVVPLLLREELLGFLLVGRQKEKHVWTNVEKTLLKSAAIAFSMALEYRDVVDSLSESRGKLEESNQRLAKEVKRADDANAAKGRFLANMSHEIRTPLNGILGYAQILERSDYFTDEDTRRIQTIRSSGVHLLTLINDILDLSKVESGKMPVEKDWFGLRHFMHEIVSMLQIKADEKGLDLSWKTEGFHALPHQVYSDMRLLRQIMLNLLGNAIKYTKAGFVRLLLKVLEKDEEKILLRFEVIDSGIGIGKSHIKQLFHEFFQVGSAQRIEESGTGLGLSLAARMVKLLGGRLQVTSELGEGSCFSFVLLMPYRSDPLAHADGLREISGYEGPRKKILVVDDILENRNILRALLEEIGFDVCEADDGDNALRACQEMHPDLILCDLVMPYISGIDFVKIIRRREEYKKIPIIAISASVSSDYYTLESLDVFEDFLPKPIERYALYEALKEHMKLPWIYSSSKEVKMDDDDDEAVCECKDLYVNPEILKKIREFAEMGDMQGIFALAEELVSDSADCKVFSDKLKKLANSFDEDRIIDLVNSMEA